jgi:hypothetical protein
VSLFDVKTREFRCSGINPPGIWVLGGWRPALRWREFLLGVSVESQEPVALMAREKSQGQSSEDESTNATHRGGALCSSYEIAVMAMERRECVVRVCTSINRVNGRSL